ncbi:type II toxin-antitoxin system VapC family toxin [Granulicella mallensis]|uniref:Ribonuclease VapC n=1 Tax=Granulicella mallensis (strain ATCC BAA-1857 / DSM 23137 / MP5ACTX8) TaxID=682795 RepID=G8NXS9_GRAMM|nr:PIN domain nuclease [Granulicella mallensis]AEU34424.1 PilT protein domain protein [Granulicella mallensis MP5ACTX8]
MVIVDTTVWIDYLAGRTNAQTAWLDAQVDHQRLGLTDLILCEILQVIRADADLKKVRRELSRFEVFSTGGETLAVASAQNYRALRRRGITVRTTIDCLIATFCLREGHSLLHHDHDFNPFEKHLGLRVVHPVT